MPRRQAAAVDVYDFGAPAAEATVLDFKVLQGGKLDLMFENQEGNPLTVSVQVSEDGTTYADTTDADNLKAVVDEVVAPASNKDFTVLARQDKDNYVRVRASGSTRANMQVRPDGVLQIRTI